MVLSRLNLINFRQYRRLELQFKDGITGIVGRNGSGKSTILEAVSWCLFGNRAARTGKEGIKRQAATSIDPCSVELEFKLGNTSYCLIRSLVGKNHRSEARLSQRDRLDAVTTREVDDYVVRLLGLNLKGFLSSFFARQKELNALSEARPADRKDHLAKMLGVGRLDSAIQLLKEDIKSNRQRIDILASFQIDPEAVQAEVAQKKSDLSNLEEAKTSLKSDLDLLEKDILKQGKDLDVMRQNQQEFNRLERDYSATMANKEATEKEISRLASELADLQEITQKIKPLKKQSSGIVELEKAVSELRQAKSTDEERKRLESEFEGLQKAEADRNASEVAAAEEIAHLQKSLEGKNVLIREIGETEANIDEFIREHREYTGELRVLEDKLAVMEKQKSEINDLGPEASCKMCLRPFGGELDEIERHFDQEILSLSQQTASLRNRIEEITTNGKTQRQQLKLKKENLESFNKLERALASAQAGQKAALEAGEKDRRRTSEIDKRLKEIGDVVFDPDKLNIQEANLKERQQKREEYIRMAERATRKPEVETALKTARSNLESLANKLDRNKAEKAQLGFDNDVFQAAVNKLDKAREKAAGIRVEIERSDGKIRLLVSEAEAGVQKLAEFEKNREEIAGLRERLTYLEKLSILFADFRVYLIGRIRPSLSRRTSQLFHEMTDGRYQEIELDEDYNLRVYDRGEHFSINRFSGGEVDLANLCFRLAISVEMAATAGIDQSFIILDEIFGSQDSERQRMIFEGLGRLKNRFRQIIIISHIDDVKEMAENIVSVEVDRTGVSQAVAVEN